MEDLNDEQRKNKLFLLVHGNGDNEDLLLLNSLFLCGRKQFESVFDREIINVTDDDASTNEVLVLRVVLHVVANFRSRNSCSRHCLPNVFVQHLAAVVPAIVIAGVPGLLLSSLLVFVDTLESFRIWNRDRGGLEVALHLNSVLKRCKTLRVFCKFQNTLFCKSVLKHG